MSAGAFFSFLASERESDGGIKSVCVVKSVRSNHYICPPTENDELNDSPLKKKSGRRKRNKFKFLISRDKIMVPYKRSVVEELTGKMAYCEKQKKHSQKN